MMLGAPQASNGISVQASAFVGQHVAEINSRVGANNISYHVISESTQVVAGTNHFLTISGNPDGKHYTITVFEPLNGGIATITEASQGDNAHLIGHSEHAHHGHDHHHEEHGHGHEGGHHGNEHHGNGHH